MSKKRIPISVTTCLSECGSSRSRRSSRLAGSVRIASASGVSRAASESNPADAAVNSAMFDAAIPANQSRPSAPFGARLTSTAVRVTRPGSRAAQASAWGPPPERPRTAKRAMSYLSAIAATSVTTSATQRPARRSEAPYPGRSNEISRMPSRYRSIPRGRGPSRLPGVPCNRMTTLPPGSPDVSTESFLPSTV